MTNLKWGILAVSIADQHEEVFAEIDMLIKETDFEPSVEQSTLPTIGVITNNWRRTHGMASEVQLKQEFKNQSIVPTGGGLAYSK